MKQAANPKMLRSAWKKRVPGYAAMGAATLVMALGLTGFMHRCVGVDGILLELDPADAGAYGISEVYRLSDGSFRVTGTGSGFKSEVTAAVTLDPQGNVISVEILSQEETETLGGRCTDPEFTAQYTGPAPFTLAGKSYTVTDPATGMAFVGADAAQGAETPAPVFDPAQWRTEDTSPEAEATRRLYAAGLTRSAMNGQPLGELAPPLDSSPEAAARRARYEAGLSQSAKDGAEQAKPFADWTPEKQAEARLRQAGLTTAQAPADAASTAQLTEVDALAGATITSKAVTDIVNNSYFYVTEVLSGS